MTQPNNWSERALEVLRREVPRGTSYSAISAMILAEAGDEKSRSAVSGAVFRLGLGEHRPLSVLEVARGKAPVLWNEETDATLLAGHAQKLSRQEFIQLFLDKHDRYASWDRIRSRLTALGATAKIRRDLASRNSGPSPVKKPKVRFRVDPEIALPSDEELSQSPVGSVALLETHRSECKYPVGDGVSGLMVCGTRATIGAYCARHAALAYQKMPTVRRNERFHCL